MDTTSLPRELRPFMDRDGRLRQWPTRQRTQRLAVALLASRFEPGRIYDERQVNELLLEWHTFGDWALLRRMLYDWGHLDRERDGSRYWVRSSTSHPASGNPSGGPGAPPTRALPAA